MAKTKKQEAPPKGQRRGRVVAPPLKIEFLNEAEVIDHAVMARYRVNGGGQEPVVVHLPGAVKLIIEAPDDNTAILAYNQICGVILAGEPHQLDPLDPDDSEDSESED